MTRGIVAILAAVAWLLALSFALGAFSAAALVLFRAGWNVVGP